MRLVNERSRSASRLVMGVAMVLVVLLLALGLTMPAGDLPLRGAADGQSVVGAVLTLALPTFLAGVFSFLSPCTLPILPAYFAFTFQAKRHQIALMTLAFFLGLATTMTILGATLSVLGRVIFAQRPVLMVLGGLLIMGFGLLSIFGKGFSGLQVQRRPGTTFAGTYVFGLTFALGWSACTGPILGALFTLMASQGITVLAGAVLALIYALGLALPLFLVAVFFKQLGRGSRAWNVLRGRAWTVSLFGRRLHLHSTSVLSGLLLMVIGYLLASGQLFRLSLVAQRSQAGAWAVAIETWISRLFGVQ